MIDTSELIKKHIRTVPDWPQVGIQFRDITTLLQDPKIFRILMDVFLARYADQKLDLVAGMDARGFILGSVLAYELNIGFVPIRKKGKLPFATLEESYDLEYGSATVEIHTDACKAGDRVLLIDDLMATGGTMMAGKRLLERLGANIVEGAVIVDLPDLGGSKLIEESGLGLFKVCEFSGH
ncbi:adenine phosphoribosyltransferase [Undibacterium fentianense]|uniref:Adenine phosphoribosyltransferase n=1 Tax=Undibacterium fentianense TaxID=2828728 RepID=A0A941E5U7_9BURK|nr:adenine phosphoribosyltransferase [Undibacterium fentianense]MBR7801627.1 adenine phosphoribosyltransferase [Undibacterium fentianense]